MLPKKQTQKNKPATKKTGKREKKETPETLSLKQIAIITGSEPPPVKELSAEEKMIENLVIKLLDKLVKKVHDYIEKTDGYYSRAEVMKIIGITSRTSFDTLLKKGLPHYRMDKKVVVNKCEFHEFLQPYRKTSTFRKAARMVILASSTLLWDAGDVLMSVC